MKVLKSAYTVFFIYIFLFVSQGCSNHNYNAKTVTRSSAFPATIERAQKDHRYFIMQSGINVYTITSVDLDKAKQQMTVTLDKVDSSHLVNSKNRETKPYEPQKGESASPSEIYLYMKDSTSYTLDEPHTIPLSLVGRVELLD